MEEIVPNSPRWGQEVIFPTNPDLADILGDTDFDFENFYLFDCLGPKFSGLVPAWARLGLTYLGPPTWASGRPVGPKQN